jgi:hydrogenase nickel incorporation protein HypB
MCATCGCSGVGDPRSLEHDHDHDHPHDHDPPHDHAHHDHADHDHAPATARTISFEQAILAKNNRLAAENRAWLAGRGATALNLMSSPGAGKTTLLERTIRDLGTKNVIAVIEGDQETRRDADRIRSAGARAIQVNTGTGCHLDAQMVSGALRELDPPSGSLLFIENVGNLVCPALFDLGEGARVVIASVTEGEDKPLKYPHMFRSARLVVLNKIDLLPHVAFDVDHFAAAAREVNPEVELLPLSATSGAGLDRWYRWLADRI